LIGEVAEPMPAEPKRPERIDSEYVRNGTADLFVISEPWAGWRHVEVTERRTAKDFAEVVRWVVEDLHPDAEKIVLVMDNRNTHKLASLYEVGGQKSLHNQKRLRPSRAVPPVAESA
jgi:DDE superfamily endonuclease